MQERRNYYRILGVQPDAPADVIRGVYRTLMQKLRMHPDLGGDQRDAATINAAWQLLRDPARRQAYDRQLLNDYDIRLLSSAGAPAKEMEDCNNRNRRNYYRVLGVQPDAPQALIDSAYQASRMAEPADDALIIEAYAIIGQPEKRCLYDAGLSTDEPTTDSAVDCYVPLIRSYCEFCKTPKNPYPGMAATDMCAVCDSPFAAAPSAATEIARSFIRRELGGAVVFHEFWPGPGHHGLLEQLSPDGLRLTTQNDLEGGQVIRVTTSEFSAVARVVHSERRDSGYSIGMSLLAVSFSSDGVFIDTAY